MESPSKNDAFSGILSGTSFFDILKFLGAQMLDFEAPVAPSPGPNGARNRPNGARKPRFLGGLGVCLGNLGKTGFKDHFRDPPVHHFGAFWMGHRYCFGSPRARTKTASAATQPRWPKSSESQHFEIPSILNRFWRLRAASSIWNRF